MFGILTKENIKDSGVVKDILMSARKPEAEHLILTALENEETRSLVFEALVNKYLQSVDKTRLGLVIADFIKNNEDALKPLLEFLGDASKRIYNESMKNSKQPWVTVVGEEYDDKTKQMKLVLDWNAAFIDLLRSKGYPSENVKDEELIQLWLRELAKQ